MTGMEYSLGEFGDARLAKGGLGCSKRSCVAAVFAFVARQRESAPRSFGRTGFSAILG